MLFPGAPAWIVLVIFGLSALFAVSAGLIIRHKLKKELKTGVAHDGMFQAVPGVTRADRPVLYWLLVAGVPLAWLAFAVYVSWQNSR